MMRRSVLLPQPDGPISEMNSPFSTSRLMFASALTVVPSAVRKVFEMLSMVMMEDIENLLALSG